jgi:hypothetical protein
MSVYMVHVEWLQEEPDTIKVISASTDGTATDVHVTSVAAAEALLAAALADFDTDRTAAINAMIAALDVEKADLQAHLGS